MVPADFDIGLKVKGRHGLEIEPITSVRIPDSPPRKISDPEELTTIYQNGEDTIGAITRAGNGVDISSPATYLEHKKDGEIVNAHLIQGNGADYSEFTLTDGNELVVRSKRTES